MSRSRTHVETIFHWNIIHDDSSLENQIRKQDLNAREHAIRSRILRPISSWNVATLIFSIIEFIKYDIYNTRNNLSSLPSISEKKKMREVLKDLRVCSRQDYSLLKFFESTKQARARPGKFPRGGAWWSDLLNRRKETGPLLDQVTHVYTIV